MTLLAIDPGRSYKGVGKARQSIGAAIFSTEGRELSRYALSFEGLVETINVDSWGSLNWNNTPIGEIVIEDFVNDPKSARGGQRNGTSECIGAVEILALQAGVPFTRQKSTILNVAKLHAGYVDTHKHLPHEDSAYLHGVYYLVSKGILHPKGLADTLG